MQLILSHRLSLTSCWVLLPQHVGNDKLSPCTQERCVEVTVQEQRRRWMEYDKGEGEMVRYDMRTANTLSRASTRYLYATQGKCVRKMRVRHGVCVHDQRLRLGAILGAECHRVWRTCPSAFEDVDADILTHEQMKRSSEHIAAHTVDDLAPLVDEKSLNDALPLLQTSFLKTSSSRSLRSRAQACEREIESGGQLCNVGFSTRPTTNTR